MATPFRLKRSAVSGKRPELGDLQLGELGLNFYDGHLFARRETNGVGIADTVSILTPWIENFGGSQISYEGDVGITGFTTFTGGVNITGSLSVTGGSSFGIDIETRHFKATGISTFQDDIFASGSISGFDELRAPHSASTKTITVKVISKTAAHRYNGTGSGSGYTLDDVEAPFLTLTPGRTYRFDQSDSSNSGHPIAFYLDAAKSAGYSTGVTNSGISAGSSGSYVEITVSDDTPTVLHYQCTAHGYMGNSVQVNSSVSTKLATARTIGLSGDLSGSASFDGSANATISASIQANSVDLGTDTVGDYVASISGTANEVEVTNGSGEGSTPQVGLPDDVTVSNSLKVGTGITAQGGIITATTFVGNGDFVDIDVDGHTDLDNVSVAGVTTFSERIVGAATTNVIPFLYSNISDLPSASTYHGAFAHVHATGKGYYAHANNWIELVNKETSGVTGTGVENYNVGVVTATTFDGDINLDNNNITGSGSVNITGIITAAALNVGTGGTVISASAETGTFAIGSATTSITATLNGGAIPSIGLVIALGG